MKRMMLREKVTNSEEQYAEAEDFALDVLADYVQSFAVLRAQLKNQASSWQTTPDSIAAAEQLIETLETGSWLQQKQYTRVLTIILAPLLDEDKENVAASENFISQYLEFLPRSPLAITTLNEILSIQVKTQSELKKPFLNSLVVEAVGVLETLVRELAAFTIHFCDTKGLPKTTNLNVPLFKIRELSEPGEIKAFFEEEIELNAGKMIATNGGLTWNGFLKTVADIDLFHFGLPKDYLEEVTQRRHAIVHNRGRVSWRYYTAFRATSPDPDGSFDTSETYIERMIEELVSHGTRVALEFFKRAGFSEDTVFRLYNATSQKLLESEVWSALRSVIEEAPTEAGSSMEVNVMRVNRWLAMKQLGMEIDDEVSAWDTSALKKDFEAARLGLLEDTPKLLKLISKNRSLLSMLHMPVLAPFRSSHGLQALISSIPTQRSTNVPHHLYDLANKSTHHVNCSELKITVDITISEPESREAFVPALCCHP